MTKSFGEWVTDQIAMLPLHLTGITAIAGAIEVAGDLVGGNKPKFEDVQRASGLIDLDGLEDCAGRDGDR